MRFLVLTVSLFLFAASAQAGDSSSGCGLGWQVAPKQSLVSSFARSLTNATFLNTIAMTMGTSGCAQHSIVMKEKEAQYFAEANYHNLMMEMAMGEGENLENFASVLGCSGASFGEELQSSYGRVFPNMAISAGGMLENVRTVIRQNEGLRQACQANG